MDDDRLERDADAVDEADVPADTGRDPEDRDVFEQHYRMSGDHDVSASDEDRWPGDVDASGPEFDEDEATRSAEQVTLSEGYRDAAAGTEDQAIEEVLLEADTTRRRAGERPSQGRRHEAGGSPATDDVTPDVDLGRAMAAPEGAGASGAGSAAGPEDYERVVEERNRYLRALADAENRRKRDQEQGQAAVQRANEQFLMGLLPLYDGFQRAMAAAHQGGSLDAVVQGLELLEKQFGSFLVNVGVEPIPTDVGDEFDPEIHEAMMRSPSADNTIPEGHISAVLESGFRLHGRVVRPVRVAVAGPSLDVQA